MCFTYYVPFTASCIGVENKQNTVTALNGSHGDLFIDTVVFRKNENIRLKI